MTVIEFIKVTCLVLSSGECCMYVLNQLFSFLLEAAYNVKTHRCMLQHVTLLGN